MEPIELHFHGPYPACTESADVFEGCEHQNSIGLYLWGVEQRAGHFRVSYIGETERSFYYRTKEHIIQTLGGNYRVIDPDQMRTGVQRIIWDGLWRRDASKRLPQFLSNYEGLAPLIKRYLFEQVVFLAPFKGERRIRKRIEGALAVHVRSSSDASSLLPSDIRYVVRSAAETPMRVNISADRHIEGLPRDLEV